MTRRGFTLVELMIVLSVLTLVTPLVWILATRAADNRDLALDQLSTAQEVRTVADALQQDRRAGQRWAGAPLGWRRGDCTVRYHLEGTTLIREAGPDCGGTQALATGVERLEVTSSGVHLTFARSVRPTLVHRTPIFLPVPR
jgi:prepilin-type N-terminal cleavage/methylation domain-containing protein